MPDRKQIEKFISTWENRGNEDKDTEVFWIDLFHKVLGVEDITELLDFQKRVSVNGTTRRIDLYLPEVKVLVEQKSSDKSLNKPILQSDGIRLTAFEQARRYGEKLPHDENPRWYVTCNFREFWIYDNNNTAKAPEIVRLKELQKDWTRLSFLINKKDEHVEQEKNISIKAGELVGKLYNAFLEEYNNPTDKDTLESLNILIVRLVFLLYAEDSGILAPRQFLKYMEEFRDRPGVFRKELKELFEILDTEGSERDPYLDDDLKAFPYVNGGLFSRRDIEIPRLNEKIINLLLDEASGGFDWSDISPTIFGALFESTLNPGTRREGGMHYTSIENIHKVIDPLFLNDLKHELIDIREKEGISRKRKVELLNDYTDKLSSLKFLDPACGSGNFLTETYLSLRRLENEVLSLLYQDQLGFLVRGLSPIKVSISQFHGIEINDFAATVANTALFIAENQMMRETEGILDIHLDFLPLTKYEGIIEGNALRIDWNEVLPSSECAYIIGNPPYLGAMLMNPEQKEDIKKVMRGFDKVGEMDYISGWFKKASDYMGGTDIKAAFVSTNSVSQGQQAVTLWKPLIEKDKLNLLFAYQSFVWSSESKGMAHVHCVIIGFTRSDKRQQKRIYTSTGVQNVENISIYLKDTPNIYVEERDLPIDHVPEMRFGSMPRDGGFFILNEEERNNLIKEYPLSEDFIHLYIGAREFINNKKRWCLWLLNVEPSKYSKSSEIMRRIAGVKKSRENSKAAATRKFAESPTLFAQIAQPETDYIAVPSTSSERRRYIPMGFLDKDIIASNALHIIPGAGLYHFGVLTSNVHNAWMRAVAGRFKSDYRYSKDIVYNNFPWPEPTEAQKERIEETAQNILAVRAKYPDSSLKDLYNELIMPADLRKAHRDNDRAVMEAYGWDWRKMTEEECVAELMKLYSQMI